MHIFTGGNSLTNTPGVIAWLNSVVNQINFDLAHNCTPGLPTVPNVVDLADTKIRFELSNIYFYNNTTLYNSQNTSAMLSYISGVDPNRLNYLSVLIPTGGQQNAATPYPSYISYGSSANDLYVYNMFAMVPADNTQNSVFYNILKHELGHCLDLLHTYSGCCYPEDCQPSPDYLSDVFGTAFNSNCWLQGGWNCNPYLSSLCTSNWMGGWAGACYLSPLQIAKIHRALSLKTTRRYVKDVALPSTVYDIASNETWDFDIRWYGDIHVKAGATLTVKCKILMSAGAKIVVERGGKLIIDGGTITNSSKVLWKGVEVWGNPFVGQSNTTSNGQGQVIIQNGGTVENAEIAVAATQLDPQGQPNFLWDGGIIRAQNAVFRNNIIGIQLWSYHGTTTQLNYSYAKNCTFETTSTWPNTSIYPKYFVDMYDVDYTSILGCTFQNLVPNSFPVGNRGEGIFSVDARFRVGNFCTNTQCTLFIPSAFTNLTYGVDASASMPLLTCAVDGAVFSSCDKGVSIRGLDYATITRGTFNITPGTLSIPHFGIYADNCTGFQIDGNTCTGSGSPAYDVGVLIRDSRDMSNIVYNNSFTNLHVGEEAIGDNDGPNIPDGLRFNCNDNLNNLYDIYVTNPTSQNNITTDIGKIQGLLDQLYPNPQQLVRNTYSAPCVASNENRFRMDKVSSQTATHNNHLTPSTTPVPCKDNLVITSNTNYTFNKPLDCPSSFGGNPSLSALQLQLSSYTTQINSQKVIVDGNNTQGLLTIIATSSSGQIKNSLLGVGPYLSDQVLLAAIAKNLPAGILKDIIIPNSPVTLAVKQAIDAISLPPGIRNQINAAQTGVSPRAILENHIDQLQFERDLLLSSEIRLILNDTTFIDPIGKVISIIKIENIPDQKCKLASAYIANKDYVKADSVLTVIEAEQSGILDNFCQLNRILIDLRQSIQGCLVLHADSIKKAAVEQIAVQVDKDGCSNAQALLMKAFASFYPEDVVFPNDGISYRVIQPELIQPNQVISDYRAFPNPAIDKLNVEYKLPSGVVNPILIVFDINGKTIIRQQISSDAGTTQLNIAELPSGLFFWRIEADGEILHSDKFSIVR